jgi:phosphoglycolate phosphatase-like HAD superfamily hydrolase
VSVLGSKTVQNEENLTERAETSFASENGLEKKAIIFDWDGTIVDSMRGKCMIFARTLRDYARLDESQFEYARSLYLRTAGEPLETQFRKVKESLQLKTVDIETLTRNFHGLIVKTPSTLFKHAREVLQLLVNRNFRLGIASSAPLEEIQTILTREGLRSTFDVVINKDSLDLALSQFQEKLGIASGEVAFVGDSAYDMQIARRHALTAVGFGVTQSPDDLLHGGANFLASDWLELGRLFRVQ